MKVKVKCTEIVWDTDGERVLNLPSARSLWVDSDADIESDEFAEDVTNALSDKFDYCVDSLSFEVVDHRTTVSEIKLPKRFGGWI